MGSFAPAIMDGVGCFIAIAGPSTCGKTKSALRLAKGLAGGKKVAAIDTEGKRMSHYSKEFDFDVVNMLSPFGGARFVTLAREAQDAGYGALVTDSFSLEWSGTGGVLAKFDELFEKANFQDKFKNICWAQAKKDHKRMLNDLIQLTIPVIFCLRANQVPDHLCKNGAEKSPGGAWKVDQDKRLIFDLTIGLMMHPATPGVPRYDMVDMLGNPIFKVNAEHRPTFPAGVQVSENAGEALRQWRFGEDARKAGSRAVGNATAAALDGDDEPPPSAEERGQAPPPPDALRDRTAAAVDRLGQVEASEQNIAKIETALASLRDDISAAGRTELAAQIDQALVGARHRIKAA